MFVVGNLYGVATQMALRWVVTLDYHRNSRRNNIRVTIKFDLAMIPLDTAHIHLLVGASKIVDSSMI